MRIITCTNEDGLGIRFGLVDSPWKLISVEGLYEVSTDVYTSDNTMTDGSTYQGSTLKERNIVMTMEDRPFAHKVSRKLLYDVFKTKTVSGVFTYMEDGDTRSIKYAVESIEIEDVGNVRRAVISLICPDPNFESPNDISVVVAGWSSMFEFDFEITDDGIEFEEKTDERLKNISNDSGSDGIGVTIKIEANGTIVNPTIAKVETQEYFTLGTESDPFTMVMGDVVTITTHTNNKHVYLTRNGVKTEINEYQTEESEYIQLMRGNNTIGYNADSGSEFMNVRVEFRYKFPGV